MGREERDPQDPRATRSARRDTQPTDRLGGSGAPVDPVNPDWRGPRVTGRNRRSQGLPSSREEFVLWLQFGGWRLLLAAVALVIVLVGLIYITRPRPLPVVSEPTPEVSDSLLPVAPLPSVTPGIFTPTVTLPPQGSVGGARFRVVNTGPEGLFLRPDHNRDNPPVKTLPDGTIVTIVGEDFVGPDRVWKHVQDPEGAQGWVAADFLQPVP